jgi:hypothetical protein
VCATVFRYLTRGEYLPLIRSHSDGVTEIDVIELGFARFSPDLPPTSGGSQCHIDEPAAIAAILKFCKDNNPIEDWLLNRWNTSEKSHGDVYEDVVIHQVYRSLSQPGGCRLDSILDFQNGAPPKWASTPVTLVAPKFVTGSDNHTTADKLKTIAATSLTLPYACSPNTWDETVLWFRGQAAGCIPICVPDAHMGPNLLCFVEYPKRGRVKRVLLGIHIGSGHKSVQEALYLINPNLFWKCSVSLLHVVYFICH